MGYPTKPELDGTSRPHNVRWSPEDWQKIEDAARIMNEREHLDLTPTDIIRSGALRRAEEIIGAAQATIAPSTDDGK